MTDGADWARETLKESPFWRDGMMPEEYDREWEYLHNHWVDFQNGKYVPLWKQAQKAKEES